MTENKEQLRQEGALLIKDFILGSVPRENNTGGIEVLCTANSGVTNTFAAKLLVTVSEAFESFSNEKKPVLNMRQIPASEIIPVSRTADNYARLTSGVKSRQVAAMQHFLNNGEDMAEHKGYSSEFTVLGPTKQTSPFANMELNLSDLLTLDKSRTWTPLQLKRLLSSEHDIESFLNPKKEGETTEDVHASIIALSRRVYDEVAQAGTVVRDLAATYHWPEVIVNQAPSAIRTNFVDVCAALMVIRIAGRVEGLSFIQETLMNKVVSGETTKFSHMPGSSNSNHPLERIVALLNTRGPAAEHSVFRSMTPSKLIQTALNYSIEGFCMTAWNHPINKKDAASPLSFFRQNTHRHVMEAKDQMVSLVQHVVIEKKPLNSLVDSRVDATNAMRQIQELKARYRALSNAATTADLPKQARSRKAAI